MPPDFTPAALPVLAAMHPYRYNRNNPFDLTTPIELVLPARMSSRDYVESIRAFAVPEDGIAVWFFGQNGFVLKSADSPLIGIDLYLTNSCAKLGAGRKFRLDRQLPVFVEPEDLDIDVFCTTHSHDDHADLETIERFAKVRRAEFIGPWESVERYRMCGVPASACHTLHPNQTLTVAANTEVTGAFALPTDDTDLNHTGIVIRFSNGIRFYNSGDTGYCDLLSSLVPRRVNVFSICMNGGFHNLDPMQAAQIVRAVDPEVAIPTHYDMMVNNVGNPEMLGIGLETVGSRARLEILDYYCPWVYRKSRG